MLWWPVRGWGGVGSCPGRKGWQGLLSLVAPPRTTLPPGGWEQVWPLHLQEEGVPVKSQHCGGLPATARSLPVPPPEGLSSSPHPRPETRNLTQPGQPHFADGQGWAGQGTCPSR